MIRIKQLKMVFFPKNNETQPFQLTVESTGTYKCSLSQNLSRSLSLNKLVLAPQY
jgi:hypothetical protein